ncbi:helix-turn-helix domain-containing protein [Lentilactobacillus sp. Marseille-Q4993]|uniref:helix-turn-helix domain-containing protein n=1 Tax=Lentilactobacillus sp. Marseille-Q4993 TaxID=3039492 RepID=UPI0024BCE61B|nr:helix-turn-helix domain-containing protein [Lentilactobacillus sp. Marseille-Q4993]
MTIGEQMKQQRKLKGWSQQDLADRMFISRQSISRWESGSSLPTIAGVIQLSDLFNLSIDSLIRGDEDLMDKLSASHKISKTKKIVLFGSILTIILFIFLMLFRVKYSLYDFVGGGIRWIAVIGFLTSLNWKQVNHTLTKSSVSWGIVVFIGVIIPELYSLVSGFTSGLGH